MAAATMVVVVVDTTQHAHTSKNVTLMGTVFKGGFVTRDRPIDEEEDPVF